MPYIDGNYFPPLVPEQEANDLNQEGAREQNLSSKERYQTWPEKVARGAVSAMALPGDVLSGKVQPGSTQEIERAADLAGLMVFGPTPVASKMAEGTLGSFAGIRSATLDRQALSKAQEMDFSGIHPEQIWQDTGFFKGADGRWRYEIPNDMGNLKPQGTEVIPGKQADPNSPKGWGDEPGPDLIKVKTPSFSERDFDFGNISLDKMDNLIFGRQSLEDVLHNPELFKAYPFLKNINVKHMDFTDGTRGIYSPSQQTIFMKPSSADNFYSTLQHEVQHAIQEYEGFARGGNMGMFSSPEFENAKAIFEQKMEQTMKELNEKFPDAEFTLGAIQAVENGDYNNLSPIFKNRIDSIINKAKEDGYYDKLHKYVVAANKIDEAHKYHYEMYRRLMGEVEARNVQARLDFDNIDRLTNSPVRTEDVPRSEQIQN